jgi:hypothetical protein
VTNTDVKMMEIHKKGLFTVTLGQRSSHLFKKFLLFICAYNVWVISSPFLPSTLFPSASSLFPLPPHFQAETILPLSLILLKREYKEQ